MLLAAGGAAGQRRRSSTCTSRSRRPTQRGTAFELAREARRAGLAAQLELDRPVAQGPAQARRPDQRPLRRDRRSEDSASLREMESGDQRELAATDVIPTILRGSRLT